MRAIVLSCLLFLATLPAHASVDFNSGSLYRTAEVPHWGATAPATFTVMLWVYGATPDPTNNNTIFSADDGGTYNQYVQIGTAPDGPTQPYFITPLGEWHFNQDGSADANPAQSFDLSLGWTFLAVTMEEGGATDLYAWQSGVNGDALVHIPAMDVGSALGGSGDVSHFVLGDQSTFDESCHCLVGPVYIYDGVALTQAQIDAQRKEAAPLLDGGLIAFSSFSGDHAVTTDESNTANWSVHGTVKFDDSNPPVQIAKGGGGVTGGGTGSGSGGGGGGGGALGIGSVLLLAAGAALRRRRRV